MRGISRFRWSPVLLLPFLLASSPGPLPAQTAQELARQQELLQKMKEQELRQREMQEALLMRVHEQEARQREMEHVLLMRAKEQEQRQFELQAVHEARQAELAQAHEAMVRAQEHRGQEAVQAAAYYEQARKQFEEALAQGQDRSREQEARLRAVEERYRELQARARDRSDEVRARTREALERAEQEAKRYQEIVVRMQSKIRLGVSLNPDQGEEFDLQGARVESVIEGSPAEEIGLEEGDVITHLGGYSLLEPIPDEADQDFDLDTSVPVQRLMALVGDLEPGDEMEIRYLRGGQPRTATFEAAEVEDPVLSLYTTGEGPLSRRILRVSPDSTFEWHFSTPEEGLIFRGTDLLELKELEELGELKKLEELEGLKELRMRVPEFNFEAWEPGYRGAYVFEGGEGPRAFTIQRGAGMYGLELADLNPELGEYFSAEDGVLVLNVDEDSELGLRPGDVILGIDGRSVEDRGDVGRILASYEDDETVTFRVMRAGSEARIEGHVR